MEISRFAALLASALFVLPAAAVASAFECDGVTPVPGDDITLELVAEFSFPVDVTAPPGDTERLFVVEQAGTIRIVDLTDDSVRTTPFLSIDSSVLSGGEYGLLGLAFHPSYHENGYFYLNYSGRSGAVCSSQPPSGCATDRESETVIARFQVSDGDPDVADPDSEQIVLSFCQPFSNHNGGQLAFGPNDGYLYISTGDGGSGGDPCGSGQRPESLLGKMLRIDVDRTDAGLNYAVPPSNPFANENGVRPEIWALGLRNPWRFSFDAENGDLYIADVGEDLWEEIDYQPGTSPGGENYEWRRREGDHDFSTTGYGPGTVTAPIYEYGHAGGAFLGCSVTGGVVYRGCRMPDLHGHYFLADYCNDWVGAFRVLNGSMVGLTNRTDDLNAGISRSVGAVSAFGTDGRGEIYICDLHYGVYRVVPVITPDDPPVAVATTRPDPAIVDLQDGLAEVTLDGSGSNDGDGGVPVGYLWEKVSGPEGDAIDQPSAAVTAVSLTETGEYIYRLTVEDAAGSDTAEVGVTVRARFVRSDANADTFVDIGDSLFILFHLFTGGASPSCVKSADLDDNGTLESADAVVLLVYLFREGPTPDAPFPVCGLDTTPDNLTCESHTPCES